MCGNRANAPEISAKTLEKERLPMNLTYQKCARNAPTVVALALCAAAAMAQGPEQRQQSYQTFYLKNAAGHNAANDIQTSMRNMIPGAKIYYAAAENALSFSGTADELALAQKMLADLDEPQKVYRVTYTITDEHNAARHLVVLVAPGKTTMTRQGTRVPIMTGSFNEAGGGPANTQFQYVDVGLSVNASLEG
jgi:type II secretory pathway component GspD/PulD (secretin)